MSVVLHAIKSYILCEDYRPTLTRSIQRGDHQNALILAQQSSGVDQNALEALFNRELSESWIEVFNAVIERAPQLINNDALRSSLKNATAFEILLNQKIDAVVQNPGFLREIFERMIKNGCNAQNACFLEKLQQRQFDLGEFLLEGNSLIVEAAQKSQWIAFKQFLEHSNWETENDTLLHKLVECRCLEGLEHLYEEDPDRAFECIDRIDSAGRTAIYLAASKNYADLVEFFVRKGADFEIRAQDGRTPQGIAIYHSYWGSNKSSKILSKASKGEFAVDGDALEKRRDAIEVLKTNGFIRLVSRESWDSDAIGDRLAERFIDPDLEVDGNRIVHLAMQNDDRRALSKLYKQGADFDQKNQSGETSFHVAVRYTSEDGLNFLQDNFGQKAFPRDELMWSLHFQNAVNMQQQMSEAYQRGMNHRSVDDDDNYAGPGTPPSFEAAFN